LAVSEFGGVPDVARMQRLGCYWSYFVSWTGDVGPKKMTVPDLQRIYDGPSIINLSQYLKSSVQSR
jgi:mannan endo-1,4-beta-mannosidase